MLSSSVATALVRADDSTFRHDEALMACLPRRKTIRFGIW